MLVAIYLDTTAASHPLSNTGKTYLLTFCEQFHRQALLHCFLK